MEIRKPHQSQNANDPMLINAEDEKSHNLNTTPFCAAARDFTTWRNNLKKKNFPLLEFVADSAGM